MPKILLYMPLAILAVLGILTVLGIAEGSFSTANLGGDPDETIYYDSGGHPVVWANLTAIGEKGWFYKTGAGHLGWVNSTGIISGVITTYYVLYWDNGGSSQIKYEDLGKTYATSSLGDISLTSSLGFIALLVGLSALAVVVGLRILGSGTSEFSVSMVISVIFWMALWGVFSVMSLALISELGNLGNILFFCLTLLYTIGVYQTAKGSGGSED